MRDLTKGSISSHILALSTPLAAGMLTHSAHQLIDLYFITGLGAAAIAGVNAAGNAGLVVLALIQVLGVGTGTLISHAIGRRDSADASLILNQAILLSLLCGVVMMGSLYVLIGPYLRHIAADEPTVRAGATFMYWVLPGLAFFFPMTVLSSALRGAGHVGPAVAFHIVTVALNAILAPILIAGWGGRPALGAMGAGLATSISLVVGTLLLAVYFHRSQRSMTVSWDLLSPRLRQWHRVLSIGLPSGAEVMIMFFSAAVVYYAIRDLGTSAQAGYAIGARAMQTILLPGLAIAMAAGPIAGQNFGAKNSDRVRETFRKAAVIAAAALFLATMLVHGWPDALVGVFDADNAAREDAVRFLKLLSLAFVAQGMVSVCSSMFQALGNTVPSMISSGVCVLFFSITAVWASTQPSFHIDQVWLLLLASVILQSMVSLWFLRREMKRHLPSLLPSTDAAR